MRAGVVSSRAPTNTTTTTSTPTHPLPALTRDGQVATPSRVATRGGGDGGAPLCRRRRNATTPRIHTGDPHKERASNVQRCVRRQSEGG